MFTCFNGATLYSFCKLLSGLSYVVVQLVFSSMGIACITIMNVLICRDSCKPRFSLVTWLVSVMVSFSCLGRLVFVRLCSLSATYTAQLSVNRSIKFNLLCSNRYIDFMNCMFLNICARGLKDMYKLTYT